uniref:Uncharacterized protein n=1 Tax=Candidatus Kentrum sp. FM TaxID=2126340 RepID=A0A450VTD4_9GAMM|nr:MAG: hypothetical protein BECKFM1743A_GA0114220_100455 [Candidatus Kentron sp. FM]VFJ48565.1 MAG: hypothetical protein BECKFM1743C_GA0114222_100613 [Candidatus Kentron sp. FM]VFK08054.1 MAG: hypothetical protein BECKFM1743B_GA0114221_100583 [Candidatus Kentron sp. FM]
MTILYAWNTARANPVAYPNVRPARLFHPSTRDRRFFGLFRYTYPPTRRYARLIRKARRGISDHDYFFMAFEATPR